MSHAYLHDIPFDTFVKYYLNNENDTDAISTNARYQPVYKVDTASTIYTAKYIDNEGITHCIKTLKPMPIDIGDIGKCIYNAKTTLTQTVPMLTAAGLQLFKKIERSQKQVSLTRESALSRDAIEELIDLSEPIFDLNVGLGYTHDADNPVPVYYIPIKDEVSDFFDNLSPYAYYGKIKDQIFYAIYQEIDNSNGGKMQFYITIDDASSVEGVGHKKIEDAIGGIRVVTDQIYQDPEYGNAYYYSILSTKTKQEVGKIYQLETHKILDYDQYGRAHFVDTYKKEGTLNYDVYFSEDDMPISPIMKYHLYMRNYKSSATAVDIDPTSDITKYSKTNTLYYKDFSDHGEIGYAYKFTEASFGPAQFHDTIKQHTAYIEDIRSALEPSARSDIPVSTSVQTVIPVTATFTSDVNNATENAAEKLMFTEAVTTTEITPPETASTTTITAPGAKAQDVAVARRGATAPHLTETGSDVKIDMSNKAISAASRIDCALSDELDKMQFSAIARIAASSQSTIKEFGELATAAIFDDYRWKAKSDELIAMAKTVLDRISEGKLTKVFFNTKDVYKLNILSDASIETARAVAVTTETKAATERDHSLQRIILDSIGNYESIPAEHVVNTYSDLPDLNNTDIASGTVYRIREESIIENGNESPTIYLANSLFKAVNNAWVEYTSQAYALPETGYNEITVQFNVMNSIKDILSTTKFFLYRNNIYVITLNKSLSKVKVMSIYKYLLDSIQEMNSFGDNDDGIMKTVSLDMCANTRKELVTNFSIVNSDLVTELSKHVSEINSFDDIDAFTKLKNIFNSVGYYEKSSIHALDRVSEDILLNKYKKAFSNIVASTMTNKDSNIYSTSVVTDKFDMYVYVNSLYQNLVKSLSVTPVENKGGSCYDYKSNNSYFGFIDYSNDLVTFDYIKTNTATASDAINVKANDALTKEERDALMRAITDQNYIKRLLNYKQYNLNAEEFNHRYSIELYRRNYHSIAESEKILETYGLDSMTTRTYEEQTFDISDLLDKSISLYTEYLYSNNNSNSNDTEDVDSTSSFNRRTLPLYIDKINDPHNTFKLKNNDTYQLKHVFSNTDEDEVLFIEALRQKIDRGE